MERRTLIGGGVLAGLSSATAWSPASAATGGGADDDGQVVAAAINDLQRTLQQQIDFEQGPWRTVARIRDQQRTHLRASRKYPDFIEVGTGVWESLYDWHVLTHQPPTTNRLADGRYVMLFPFTTLVLREEYDANFVGLPFDGDRPR